MDSQTDTTDCSTFSANRVGNQKHSKTMNSAANAQVHLHIKYCIVHKQALVQHGNKHFLVYRTVTSSAGSTNKC